MDLTQHPLHPTPMTADENAAARSGELETRLVDDDAEFEALRAQWRTLAERVEQTSAFHSFEWFAAAWQWRRLDSRLAIVTAMRGGKLVGLLPLTEQHSNGRRSGRFSFLNVPDTQLCEPLIAAGEDADAVAAALVRTLLRTRRGVRLDVPHLSPASRARAALSQALSAAGFRVAAAPQAGNPFIAIGGAWSAYYSGRSRSLKKTCNLAANRLAKAGAVEVIHHREFPEGVSDTLLQQFIDVSARSWKVETGNSLDQAGPGAFIQRLSTEAAGRGWLSLWLLRVDGRPVAMEYQLAHGVNVHALRADFDEALRDAGPGVHLNKALLESMFGTGLDRYLMGPGDNPYKFRWTDESEPLERIEAYFPGLRGAAVATLELRIKPWLRRWRDRLRRQPAESEADKKTPEADR